MSNDAGPPGSGEREAPVRSDLPSGHDGARTSGGDGTRKPVLEDTSARIYPRDEHPISRRDISDAAMKVLYRLISCGHQAFLVGGGVRDLLLDGEPKDFDVATDATPEEVAELFRNCRLIGRRFRLAHIRFGREIIEVATFRSGSADDTAVVDSEALPSRRQASADEPAAAQNEGGMLLRDNVYGTIEEDALRRDFTINALYYTPADFCIYDFAGGVEDLDARRIRLIGDPQQRYREDPVRMLRAIRFAAKLDFRIDRATAAPIRELAELLLDIPPARLFDEIGKLFLHGHGLATFELLRLHGLLVHLFPAAEGAMARDPTAEALISIALVGTDDRVADDRPVTPGFLLAALLWPPVLEVQRRLVLDGQAPAEALEAAASEVLAAQQQHTAVPRRFTTFIRETWALQARLERPGRRIDRIMEHPRFRAAYDFLVVREEAGEGTDGMGDWWTRYQDASEDERADLRDAVASRRGSTAPLPGEAGAPGDGPRRRRRGRRGGRRGGRPRSNGED